MSDGRAALPSRLAWALPAMFLCLLMPGRAGVAASPDYGDTGVAGVVFTLVLFALPLAYTVPRGRVVWDRHWRWLIVAQTILTFLPFALFGERWVVGLSGLLAGLILLATPARASWLLFGAVLTAEAVLRLLVFGLYPSSEFYYAAWVFSVPLDIALPLFGLVRLADMVADLRAARTELAALAVARERAQARARLRVAVGDRMDGVTACVRSALAVLTRAPDAARARLAEAAAEARQAVEQVRRVVVGEQPESGPRATRRARAAVAPRLSLLILVVFTTVYSTQNIVNVWGSGLEPKDQLIGTVAIVAIVAIQLYHSVAGRFGAQPRFWRLSLTVQVLLPSVVGFATVEYVGVGVTVMSAFPAASALLLLTGWFAWVVFAAIVIVLGFIWPLAYAAFPFGSAVYWAGLTASTGLAVYGLSRLTNLAEELEATRRRLALAAVKQERLRVAQDTHDMLGQGLSVIALKCDLAGRLIGRDDARVRAELEAVFQLDEGIRADMRAVASGVHSMSLRAELAAAREVLAWAGITVNVLGDPPEAPDEVAAILATVVRETVTNMLRHADATCCEIRLASGDDVADLWVINDGAPVDRQQGLTGGRGLSNLTARVSGLGGQLSTRTGGGRFELHVHVPLAVAAKHREASMRSGADETFAAGGPTHGVDKVISGPILEDEA